LLPTEQEQGNIFKSPSPQESSDLEHPLNRDHIGIPSEEDSLFGQQKDPPFSLDLEDYFHPTSSQNSPDLEDRLKREYIGLTIIEARSLARQQNRRFRIGSADDGEYRVLTAEHCTGRITAHVEDGFVYSIGIELP